MRHEYDIAPSEVDAFIATVDGEFPGWEVPDGLFREKIKKLESGTSRAFNALLEAIKKGEHPELDGSEPLERLLAPFFLSLFKRWMAGDELQFNLSPRDAYVVTLTAVEPITPELKPDRKARELRWGWWLAWDPKSVSKVTRRQR